MIDIAQKLQEQGKKDGLSPKTIRSDIESALEGIASERWIRALVPPESKDSSKIRRKAEKFAAQVPQVTSDKEPIDDIQDETSEQEIKEEVEKSQKKPFEYKVTPDQVETPAETAARQAAAPEQIIGTVGENLERKDLPIWHNMSIEKLRDLVTTQQQTYESYRKDSQDEIRKLVERIAELEEIIKKSSFTPATDVPSKTLILELNDRFRSTINSAYLRSLKLQLFHDGNGKITDVMLLKKEGEATKKL